MNKFLLFLTTIAFSIASWTVQSSELTYKFKSPSFSGNGQSSHYLTIENIEKTRKDAIEAKKKADAKALEDEIKATAFAKFKANLSLSVSAGKVIFDVK